MNFDKEYFFVLKPQDDKYPYLVPDSNTENRNYDFEIEPVGSPPLVFYNGWKAENIQSGIVSVTPDILFSGTDLVVRTRLRDKLLQMSIPDLHMQPAIYVGDDGKWNEDFWYLTFTKRFDCWDRNKSEYDQDEPPVQLGGYELHQVYSYSLNAELLSRTPIENRLLFKMGGDLTAYVVCHRSLALLLGGNGSSGALLKAIEDY